ncbi:hypothetical protein BANRA_05156 [Klebsiella pneumoniae]|nr:hypothetical protein BANRA_05156 [Klebsiella pneumoniae]
MESHKQELLFLQMIKIFKSGMNRINNLKLILNREQGL